MQIEISDGLGAWLQEVAAKAGKTPEQLVSEALERELENREDYEEAVEVSRRIASGEEKTYSLEEVQRRLDLST